MPTTNIFQRVSQHSNTSVKNMTYIGGNIDISGYGKIKINSVNIKRYNLKSK